jgi:hypothetical protein
MATTISRIYGVILLRFCFGANHRILRFDKFRSFNEICFSVCPGVILETPALASFFLSYLIFLKVSRCLWKIQKVKKKMSYDDDFAQRFRDGFKRLIANPFLMGMSAAFGMAVGGSSFKDFMAD